MNLSKRKYSKRKSWRGNPLLTEEEKEGRKRLKKNNNMQKIPPEKAREYNRRWREKMLKENPEKYKLMRQRHWLKTQYNITPEDKDALKEKQNGTCKNPFCNVKLIEDNSKNFINIDHDHITGEVRGIMCRICNTDLGRIEKDPLRIKGLLQLAEEYQKIREELLQNERRTIKNL